MAVSKEIKEVIEFIDEMRARGAIEVGFNGISVKFEGKHNVTTEVLVDKRAQAVDDFYAEEDRYWNQSIDTGSEV